MGHNVSIIMYLCINTCTLPDQTGRKAPSIFSAADDKFIYRVFHFLQAETLSDSGQCISSSRSRTKEALVLRYGRFMEIFSFVLNPIRDNVKSNE